MSNRKSMSSLIVILFLFQMQSIAQERVLPVEFEDGKSFDIIFMDDNPDNIPNWNLTWRFINANIVNNKTSEESSEVEALVGPVALDFDFQKFFSGSKRWLNIRGTGMPDTRYVDNRSEELRKRFLSGEINYTHQFFGFECFRKRKLNFSDHSGGFTSSGRKYKNIYRVRTMLKERVSFGGRGGAIWLQQSFKSSKTKYSDNGYSIYSGDKTLLNIGLSATRITNLALRCTDNFSAGKKVITNSFGAQKAFMISGIYVDLLYATQMNLYGENAEFSGKLPAEELIDVKDIGIRFGGFRKVSKINANFASFYFFDIGWFPSALKDFRVNFGLGYTFGAFKVKDDPFEVD